MNGGFVFLGRKIAIRCLQRLLHFYSARKRNNSVARVDIDRNSVLDTRIRFFRKDLPQSVKQLELRPLKERCATDQK